MDFIVPLGQAMIFDMQKIAQGQGRSKAGSCRASMRFYCSLIIPRRLLYPTLTISREQAKTSSGGDLFRLTACTGIFSY